MPMYNYAYSSSYIKSGKDGENGYKFERAYDNGKVITNGYVIKDGQTKFYIDNIVQHNGIIYYLITNTNTQEQYYVPEANFLTYIENSNSQGLLLQ